MIGIFGKPCHPARELLEMPLSALCTAVLESCFQRIRSSSSFLDLLAGMHFSITVYSKVLNSKIDPDDTNRVVRRCFRGLYDNTEIEDVLNQDEVSLASDPVHPGSLILSDSDRYSLPAIKGNQRDLLKPLPGEDPLVVNNRSIKPKFWLNGLVSLVGFADFANRQDGKLSRETKLLSDRVIDGLLNFNLVCTMQSKNRLRDVVTSLVKPLHCFTEHLMLLWRWIESHHQGLKHTIDDNHQWIYSYRTRLIPNLKDGDSAAEVRY